MELNTLKMTAHQHIRSSGCCLSSMEYSTVVTSSVVTSICLFALIHAHTLVGEGMCVCVYVCVYASDLDTLFFFLCIDRETNKTVFLPLL